MAWQLIYTSAPRLLEAGRSGFGTVARHRQISPLLVSAIERASQFARQPGLDPDRVVFAHRIVAVGGGRFHVLSCIRDAGADYTGRTNHIAHHLIAEPREIAALGSSGPSPADILLAMPWVAAWHEAPRHLDADEEIALVHFSAPPSDGSAWARLTGEPSHAWLLANGEASRGAYLVVPAGTDLRPLFAESLRLKPERAWQNGFITSLQPSDEPSDFRWIGLESTSPLRAQAESSGRPTLDLTAPHALPHAEVSATASAHGASLPFAPEGSAAREPSAPVRRQEVDPFQTYKPTSRMPWKWIVAGTGAALLVVGIAGTMWLRAAGQQEVFESEIDRVLGSESTGYFSDATKSELKNVPTELRPVALDLAKGGRDLARAKKAASGSARAEAITTVETAGASLQRAGRNVPAQISDLLRQGMSADADAMRIAKVVPSPGETPKDARPAPSKLPAAQPPPETAVENPPAKTPAAATTPIYFVNGLAALKESRFQEVGKGLTYFLRATIQSEPAPLIDPTAQGKWRRNMSESPVFTVDETAKQITPTPTGGALHPPFVLLAREPGGRDVAQWWVLAESPTPLLPKRVAGLTRTGDVFSLDAAKLGLPGVSKNPLKLLLPDAFALPGKKNESLALHDWKADLAPQRVELEKLREAAKTKIKELEEALSTKPDRDPTPDFREKKKTIAETVRRDIAAWTAKESERIERTMKKDEENKRKDQHKAIGKQRKEKEDAAAKELTDGKGPLFQELGGCLVALCTGADFRERDPLYTLGTELRAMNEKTDAKDQAALLAKTRKKVTDALGQLSSMPESKARYEVTLKELDAMIRLISPETDGSKAERARQQALWKTQLTARQDELRGIAAHPLLAGHSPPLAGRLMVVSEGAEIPLMEIGFSW